MDRESLVFDEMVMPVQVDGKLRDRVSVSRTAGEEEIRQKALAAALPMWRAVRRPR